MEEYKGEGLRGPGWTIAGVEILRAAKEVLGSGGIAGLVGGGGNGASAALLAENAQLKAEKYADNRVEAYDANLKEKWIKPLSDEVADARVREARMEEQIKCIEKTHALELALVKQEAQCCCDKVNARVDGVEKTLSGLVVVKIAASAVETKAA